MKIFYAVQATGNGHISRAQEIYPILKQYGNVDIFLSGNNSHLNFGFPVKYKSKGLSLKYSANGGLDYWAILQQCNFLRINKEIADLPLDDYDLILNDFDFITSRACIKKKKDSIHFGHQASFVSTLVPRPSRKNWVGEFVLQNYAKGTKNLGFHFNEYDSFIFEPIVKQKIIEAPRVNSNHITIYLSAFSSSTLTKYLSALEEFTFQIFAPDCQQKYVHKNLHFFPVSNTDFTESLIACTAIITGAGFETPAEALHLGKPLICIPIKGQYEQLCNAAALEKLGVSILPNFTSEFPAYFRAWMKNSIPVLRNYSESAIKAIHHLFEL